MTILSFKHWKSQSLGGICSPNYSAMGRIGSLSKRFRRSWRSCWGAGRRLADGRVGVVPMATSRKAHRHGDWPGDGEDSEGAQPVRILGAPVAFHSALVPPYVRRSRSLDAAIPWLYLKGVAAGEMRTALTALVGSQAKGLSANVVGRLNVNGNRNTRRGRSGGWTARGASLTRPRRRRTRRVSGTRKCTPRRRVYMWADGIYSGLRASSEKLCALVVIDSSHP